MNPNWNTIYRKYQLAFMEWLEYSHKKGLSASPRAMMIFHLGGSNRAKHFANYYLPNTGILIPFFKANGLKLKIHKSSNEQFFKEIEWSFKKLNKQLK